MEQRPRETRQPDEILSPAQARDREIEVEVQRRLEERLRESTDRYDSRIVQARKKFSARLFNTGTILKIMGLGALDLSSAGTIYSAADIGVFAAGAMDLVAAISQGDRDKEERLKLGTRGVLKMGAAAAPFVPSAAAGPVIDAVSEVDRNRPKSDQT